MEYKPVWPASGRDFCTLVLLRELGEGVYCMACEAVSNSIRYLHRVWGSSPSQSFPRKSVAVCQIHNAKCW